MNLALLDTPAESVARHVGVPVHECACGIVLPGPDMQRVERRKPETVGALEEMKEQQRLELWRYWDRKIPNNPFVWRQLAAAAIR